MQCTGVAAQFRRVAPVLAYMAAQTRRPPIKELLYYHGVITLPRIPNTARSFAAMAGLSVISPQKVGSSAAIGGAHVRSHHRVFTLSYVHSLALSVATAARHSVHCEQAQRGTRWTQVKGGSAGREVGGGRAASSLRYLSSTSSCSHLCPFHGRARTAATLRQRRPRGQRRSRPARRSQWRTQARH